FWHDIWYCDICFNEKFKWLFNLELQKDAKVASKLQASNVASSFRWPPRSSIKNSQFIKLGQTLSSISLSSVSDKWSWTLHELGDFSVKSAREEIDKYVLVVSPSQNRWSKVLPIKLNVFSWRMMPDRFLPDGGTIIFLSLMIHLDRIPSSMGISLEMIFVESRVSSPETTFVESKEDLWKQVFPVGTEVVSPFPPSVKIGINSTQRAAKEIVDMKQRKIDWVPYIPYRKRGASIERLNSQIYIVSCVQRRAALKHLKDDRVKKFKYCLPCEYF
nr:protein heat intolerant 4-like [Tanacetum cinerariifolium]